jgi:nitrite reductase/ring-hydroxylating ferredoxin subunit
VIGEVFPVDSPLVPRAGYDEARAGVFMVPRPSYLAYGDDQERGAGMSRLVRVGAVADFVDGDLRQVDADGTAVVVARDGDALCAADNRCPHMGFSLTKGPGGVRFADGVVQCPWHNSRFAFCSGENLDWAVGFAGRNMPRWSRRLIALGKEPKGLTTYPVVVEGEDVFVEL